LRQKYLGEKGLIGFIAFLSAFVPLSTDLYLPALPGMAKYFGVTSDLANLTLILFFVFFAAGALFWGPLSDKYGRRPILLIGLSIYSLAGFLCAGSGDIYHLILFRILQAVGGSGAFAVATAIIKDVYDAKNRELILALVQSMVLISPMTAPVLGKARHSGEKPGLRDFAHHFFLAERVQHGFHSIIIIYLYKWLRPERASLQLLFCLQCNWNDRGTNAVSADGPALHAQIDHHGMFCRHLGQWIFDCSHRRLQTHDICPGAAACHGHGQLCANSRRKSDAAAAGRGYRLSLSPDELLWHLYGQRRHDHHLASLEQYHPGPGSNEHPHRFDLSCLMAALIQ